MHVPHTADIICAPATPVGGAVSVIRVSGPGTFRMVGSIVEFRSPRPLGAGSIRYGVIEGLDDVLVSCFKAPRSYTGEDCVEIGCHGSAYIVRRILELLYGAGARAAEPGEFTRRAFLNGKMDLAEAEAVADLIAAESEYAHRVAYDQMRGGYSAELREIRDKMLEICSLLELELDFSEEDVEFADRGHLRSLMEAALQRCRSLADSFSLGNAVRSGIPVVIAGAPNSGKSTLLNALVGEDRAIVSDIPGTTRDTVEERLFLGGVEFRFIDTAGIRESADYVESLGIGRTLESIRRAGIVICLEDASAASPGTDARGNAPKDGPTTAAVREMIDPDRQKLLTVYSKTDLAPAPSGAIGVCAPKGLGLQELKDAILAASPAAALGGEGSLVTNERHYHALVNAETALAHAQEALADGTPTDLLAEDVREAISQLGSITGEITSQDVLNNIFSRFCIGK